MCLNLSISSNQAQREALSRAYVLYSEFYVPESDRRALVANMATVRLLYGSKGQLLADSLLILLAARLALAHSIIFMKIEVLIPPLFICTLSEPRLSLLIDGCCS